MKEIDQYLDRVKHLPPAPLVAMQLLDLFSDPDRDIDRIVELVSNDPALTAENAEALQRQPFQGGRTGGGHVRSGHPFGVL